MGNCKAIRSVDDHSEKGDPLEPLDSASLVLRLVLGGVMLAHGVKHLGGRQRTTNWFRSIGFRAPAVQWFASTATEIGVGVLLIVGLLTQAAAAGVIGVMVVAYVAVHRRVGFWVTARPDEGWEYVLVLGVVAVSVAISGPGAVSLDAALGIADFLNGWVGVGAVALGILAAAAQIKLFYHPDDVEHS